MIIRVYVQIFSAVLTPVIGGLSNHIQLELITYLRNKTHNNDQYYEGRKASK